jgi:sugar phosphate isomerase/epimerase
MNRRHLLLASSALLAPAHAPPAVAAAPGDGGPLLDRICLFTDHLDDFGYSYTEVAGMLKQLGVAGPDLTVRGGGLVPPERAAEELPKAVKAFREAGLSVPMVSTGITSDDAASRALLATIGKQGIRFLKTGYYHYDNADQWEARLREARGQLERVMRVAQEAGVQIGLHNHAGASVGGALWDGWEVLHPLDANWAGFYFDPAQATIEGGNHAWELNFRRSAPRLKMVAIKDFVWEKTGDGWRTRWCPLGEGMVRWPQFFRMLARTPFPGPISLHIEYDPGGATRAARFENSFAAAERDLKFLRAQITAAIPPKAG